MTLHDAIVKLLYEMGRPMTTKEIATGLNQRGWYQKKDESEISDFQIHGRTKNYPRLFERNGSIVSLVDHSYLYAPKVEKPVKIELKIPYNTFSNFASLERALFDDGNFKPAEYIDSEVPHNPGLYCIRINDANLLPSPFDQRLRYRNHNIVYIGIASQSLKKRFLGQELRAIGHGTFFRSIGAILGFRPPWGSLTDKANKRNYRFSPSDEVKIINWINTNLKVNWVSFSGKLDLVEDRLIKKYLPLINIANNPQPVSELSVLRAECVRIANGLL